MKGEEVNFKYKFAEDYNPIYSNGAYGGVSPRGEIVINFYLERNPIPHTETVEINSKGEFVGKPKLDPENHDKNVIRYVSTGIIMNLESAKALHQWLGEHIEYLEMDKKKEEGG